MTFGRFFERFKAFQRRMFRGAQVVLMHVCLFVLYYVGFGATRLVMMVFARRTLFHRPPRGGGGDTFWRDAEGYELDPVRLTRQS